MTINNLLTHFLISFCTYSAFWKKALHNGLVVLVSQHSFWKVLHNDLVVISLCRKKAIYFMDIRESGKSLLKILSKLQNYFLLSYVYHAFYQKNAPFLSKEFGIRVQNTLDQSHRKNAVLFLKNYAWSIRATNSWNKSTNCIKKLVVSFLSIFAYCVTKWKQSHLLTWKIEKFLIFFYRIWKWGKSRCRPKIRHWIETKLRFKSCW